ncbi:MAG: DsbA family protein [Pseudomonadales bacterium]|jgi:2-hydroxychromene-2-carboxylate isomerase|nr:DsbA family protein [Pseudomonadales bacterium]MDP4874750.1 DsbA family protein [Pseudomonadales bacterium]MDP4911039.1 DsbA family protein [Pseudomonadales bacterium]
MANVTKFKFYFSFRSPFAAIAVYRIRRLAIFNDFEIALIPTWPEVIFGGHMDNPTDNLFKISYVFADAARQAEEAGLPADYLHALAKHFLIPTDVDFKKEKVGLKMPAENWPLTHHAFLYAQERGKGWEFADAVFAERFSFHGGKSQDVTDPEVLRGIAEQLDLNPTELVTAYEAGTYADKQAEFVRQSEIDGTFGVPFFVCGEGESKQVFWGNDRIANLHKALTKSAELPVIRSSDLVKVQAGR